MKRCKEKNLSSKKFEKIKEDVKKAEYICKKCLRVSSKKKELCKPESLD